MCLGGVSDVSNALAHLRSTILPEKISAILYIDVIQNNKSSREVTEKNQLEI